MHFGKQYQALTAGVGFIPYKQTQAEARICNIMSMSSQNFAWLGKLDKTFQPCLVLYL